MEAKTGQPAELNRETIVELHNQFRTIRHAACNGIAVISALAEMAERNPTYTEKLVKMIAEKNPQIVVDLDKMDEEFRALIRALPPEE